MVCLFLVTFVSWTFFILTLAVSYIANCGKHSTLSLQATASAQTPALMVTLRCVKGDERPFAMGLQFVFFRALGKSWGEKSIIIFN